MSFHQPLEISYWFVNVFSSGDWNLFSLLGVMVITSLCAMFRMQTNAFLMMLVLFSGILFAQGESFLLIALIIILAPILFWITRRITE